MSTLNLGDSLILDSDYSTTEKKTGATWIDGKPIYRKTIVGSLSLTVGDTQYRDAPLSHNISNLAKAVHWEVLLNVATYDIELPYIYPAATTRSLCAYAVDDTYIRFAYCNLTSGFANPDCWITIFYTKTTD